MKFGNLDFEPVQDNIGLVAEVTRRKIVNNNLWNILVAQIDPKLSDTSSFCEKYNIDMALSANCVIVEARRADRVWNAAIVVLATTKADINGTVRRELDARKISFASMDKTLELTGMEFGAINPIGLAADWPVLVDEQVAKLSHVVIGSGLRQSKLLVNGSTLVSLPNVKVLNLVKV